VKRVTIVPDGDFLGQVHHYPIKGKWFQPDIEINTRTVIYIESTITALLAGPAAERKYRGRWNHVGASGDYDRALDLAFRLVSSRKQLDHYWAWRCQIAADLWENRFVWEQVERLAAELVVRETMSGRAVKEFLFPPLSDVEVAKLARPLEGGS
jgi:hypothetical protein